MTDKISSNIDWKEVKITAVVTITTAFVGCLVAVVLAEAVLVPGIKKIMAKKPEKEKDPKKA